MGLFGIDPVGMATDALMEVDLDKDKIPDVYEALDAAEEGLEVLADFLDDIEEEEAVALLKMVNKARKPEKRRTDEELHLIAKKVIAIPVGLRAAKGALENTEAALKSKQKKKK